MTEEQKKLMLYVEARVENIIGEKETNHIMPLLATENDIVANVRADVLECMRELYRQDKYIPTNTLNHPALLKKNKYDRDKKK